MVSALQLHLSGWWSWLLGRRRPASAPPMGPPPSAAAAASAPVVAPVMPAAETRLEADHAELTQTLLATVGLPAAGVPVPIEADPGRRERTLAKLENLRQIPALQSLASGFLKATSRDEASLDEIVAVVQKDPALCVRVLRMANSAFVSPAQRIEDIMAAVQMLGVRRVRTLATALFTMRDSHSVAAGFDWKHLWIHGLATAAVAEELEQRLGLPAQPGLHLAALMHDVGKIVLSTTEPEAYRAVLVESWQGGPRLEALEEARLGVGHGEAGEIFARLNGLPGEIIAAIAHHARPEQAEAHQLLVALVSVANFTCKTYGLGFSGARLDEADGDFETLPAWPVIARHGGGRADPARLEQQLRAFVAQLKPELQSLTEAA
ncbi:MAG: HDOD domain-containing protein [Opitutae bacterium]|nr:HDOD domain-containing protein [Opitutae bacterium]